MAAEHQRMQSFKRMFIQSLVPVSVELRVDRVCRSRAAARWHTQTLHQVLAKLSRVASKRL